MSKRFWVLLSALIIIAGIIIIYVGKTHGAPLIICTGDSSEGLFVGRNYGEQVSLYDRDVQPTVQDRVLQHTQHSLGIQGSR